MTTPAETYVVSCVILSLGYGLVIARNGQEGRRSTSPQLRDVLQQHLG